MSSSEEKTDKKTIITRNKRICTLLVNESNYKKVLFFPFHESQTFTSTDRKIVETCNKWNPIKKTNSSSDGGANSTIRADLTGVFFLIRKFYRNDSVKISPNPICYIGKWVPEKRWVSCRHYFFWIRYLRKLRLFAPSV